MIRCAERTLTFQFGVFPKQPKIDSSFFGQFYVLVMFGRYLFQKRKIKMSGSFQRSVSYYFNIFAFVVIFCCF